jgi:hypothetical protein
LRRNCRAEEIFNAALEEVGADLDAAGLPSRDFRLVATLIRSRKAEYIGAIEQHQGGARMRLH